MSLLISCQLCLGQNEVIQEILFKIVGLEPVVIITVYFKQWVCVCLCGSSQ